MASFLLEKYGKATLPVGRVLWTRKKELWTIPDSRVFFYVAQGSSTFGGSHEYKCAVIRPITLITPFCLNTNVFGRTHSLLFDLCKDLNVSVCVDDVTPQWKTFHSNELINRLVDLGIDGWYHPMEKSTYRMEVCLFKPSSTCLLLNEDEPIYAFLGKANKAEIKSDLLPVFKSDLMESHVPWHCLEYLVSEDN